MPTTLTPSLPDSEARFSHGSGPEPHAYLVAHDEPEPARPDAETSRSMARAAYEQALAAASATYRSEWKAAQDAPTLAEAHRLASDAEARRIAAWQSAARALRETAGA